jgi:hypothetical protein
MRWKRYVAFAVGLVSGAAFLLFVVLPPTSGMDVWEALTLLAGPVTLVAASLVGLKFERVAGWWLLAGSVVTAALLFVQLVPWQPGITTLLVVPAIFCLPMLLSGFLWLAHAHAHAAGPNGANLPMMP